MGYQMNATKKHEHTNSTKQLARKTHRVAPFVLGLLGLIALSASSGVLPGGSPRAGAVVEPQKTGADGKISDSAAQQIQALLAEKESRTPAQQKLDSQLVYAIKFRRGDSLRAVVQTLETGIEVDSQDRVVVDITAKVEGSLIEDLAAGGG